jgi:hypothetical protein
MLPSFREKHTNSVHINLSDKIPSFVTIGCSEGFTPLVICFLLMETVLIVSLFKKCKSAFVGGGTVVKVLCYKSEGRWFDSIGIFH